MDLMNFIKKNKEKLIMLSGFLVVLCLGFVSGCFYSSEQVNNYDVIIEDSSQGCKDLFNSKIVNNNFNNTPQVRGDQNKIDDFILQNKTGAFVASKNSKIYHSSNCQYVKRIKEENKIWFQSIEEAEKKGYEAHSCIKGE